MDEKKHGLYKVADQADRMARLVMDQLAKDGCANLENIRNALMAPLITIEQDHQDDLTKLAKAKMFAHEQWLPDRALMSEMMPIDMGVDLALQDAQNEYARKPERRATISEEARHKAADAIMQPNSIYEGMRQRGMMPMSIGVDPAAWSGVDADGNGCIKLWEMRRSPNGHEDRRTVQATRPLLKALGDAIATQKPQRVSINDGTYVLPDGEVLSELEMIKRSGTDGRGKPD